MSKKPVDKCPKHGDLYGKGCWQCDFDKMDDPPKKTKKKKGKKRE